VSTRRPALISYEEPGLRPSRLHLDVSVKSRSLLTAVIPDVHRVAEQALGPGKPRAQDVTIEVLLQDSATDRLTLIA
jgi:hypothetical protein